MHLCCSEPERCVFCLSRKAESTVVQILTHFACLLRTHQTANFESLSFCSARWDQIRYSAMVNGNNIKSRKFFDVWSHVTLRTQKRLIELIFRKIYMYLTRPKSHLLCGPGTFDNCVITCCDRDVRSAKKYDCFKHQIYQYSFLLKFWILCPVHFLSNSYRSRRQRSKIFVKHSSFLKILPCKTDKSWKQQFTIIVILDVKSLFLR